MPRRWSAPRPCATYLTPARGCSMGYPAFNVFIVIDSLLIGGKYRRTRPRGEAGAAPRRTPEAHCHLASRSCRRPTQGEQGDASSDNLYRTSRPSASRPTRRPIPRRREGPGKDRAAQVQEAAPRGRPAGRRPAIIPRTRDPDSGPSPTVSARAGRAARGRHGDRRAPVWGKLRERAIALSILHHRARDHAEGAVQAVPAEPSGTAGPPSRPAVRARPARPGAGPEPLAAPCAPPDASHREPADFLRSQRDPRVQYAGI